MANTANAIQNVIIKVGERFDYSQHKSFRQGYETYALEQVEYRVDLSGTAYMDSSALGMLLMLKEHADKTASHVTLYRPRENVRKVLSMAHFDKLFAIGS